MMLTNKSGNRVLSNEELHRAAPAIFAGAPKAGLSDRYSFLPTIAVIEALRGAGWQPVAAAESRTREATRAGVQKHMVRLRHADMAVRAVGDVIPELVLLNSHDGTSAYQLHAGLFRLVCSNGLIVADGTFARMSIRHSNVAPDEAIEASYKVIEEVPRITGAVEGMRSVQLDRAEQVAFAEAATRLRWEEGNAPVEARALLTQRRTADGAADLWTTLNVVQENVIRGGLRGRNANGGRMRTRAVASVDADTKLNKALWTLAEEMRKIKAA